MRYTDIMWDFDGTLVDSYPNCVRAYAEMLKSFGCEESNETIKLTMLKTTRYANRFFGEKYGLEPTEMRRRYREFEGYLPDIVRPYAPVPTVLRRIKESGRRNHLYTNRDHRSIRYLEALDLLQYFDGLMTNEEMAANKPDPCGMFQLLEQYSVKPENALMVGDRDLDIISARAAGVDGCYVDTNGILPTVPVEIYLPTIGDLIKLPEYL